MHQTKPNRDRNQSTGRHHVSQKQSGDQHVLPADEPENDPHRPHRVNRQDMEKLMPPESDQDVKGKP